MSVNYFLSSIFLTYMVQWSVQVCAPDCRNVDPGTFVQDPTDCTKYYVCLSINGMMIPSDDPVECPDGEFFNMDHTVPRCDPMDLAPPNFCTGLCNPCVPDCRLDNMGTVQPDPMNCGSYYVCLADQNLLDEECPGSNPYFDYQTGNCQTDFTLCYDYCDPCLPHCTIDNERIPDPMDCHRFYLCNPPDIANFLCPSNGVFDPVTGECGNYPCNTICSNSTFIDDDD